MHFRSLIRRWCLVVLLPAGAGCERTRPRDVEAASVGQWVWTRADAERFVESAAALPGLEAAVFIGSVECDATTRQLEARAGLAASVVSAPHPTAVIRLEDGLDQCRGVSDASAAFNASLDSVVAVLRQRGGRVAYDAVQLDYDAPERALPAWAASVTHLRRGSLRGDSVWVTSLITHVRRPEYGALFRDVVSGHVLQVFDTGEAATEALVSQAVRSTQRARVPFRLGLGAFERDTRRGRTEHRAWFGAVRRFAGVEGYRGIWVFPAGQRWVSIFRESS